MYSQISKIEHGHYNTPAFRRMCRLLPLVLLLLFYCIINLSVFGEYTPENLIITTIIIVCFIYIYAPSFVFRRSATKWRFILFVIVNFIIYYSYEFYFDYINNNIFDLIDISAMETPSDSPVTMVFEFSMPEVIVITFHLIFLRTIVFVSLFPDEAANVSLNIIRFSLFFLPFLSTIFGLKLVLDYETLVQAVAISLVYDALLKNGELVYSSALSEILKKQEKRL